jgi:hypothetical protein
VSYSFLRGHSITLWCVLIARLPRNLYEVGIQSYGGGDEA